MNQHHKRPAAPPPPPWWHGWVNSLLGPWGATYNKISSHIRKSLYGRPGVLLGLVGLMMQVFCLWLLHELIIVIMKMVELGAALAAKFLEHSS